MIPSSIVQYVGYQVRHESRDYAFLVRAAGGESREFLLSISNEAFQSHRARFQDAPDICSIRLRQELAAHDHPEQSKFTITDSDLEAYRVAHSPKPVRHAGFYKPASQ